jgi:hypothetical protein
MAQFNPMGSMGGGGGMTGFNPQNMQSFLGGASNPYDEEWMRKMMGGQGGPQQPYGRPGQGLPGGFGGGQGGPIGNYGLPGNPLPQGGLGGVPPAGFSTSPYGGPQNAGLRPPGGSTPPGNPGTGGQPYRPPYKPPQKPGYPPSPNTPTTVGVNTGNWGGVEGPGGLYKSGGGGGYGPGMWFPGKP